MIRKKLLLLMFASIYMIHCPKATINYAMVIKSTGEVRWQIDNVFLSNDIKVMDIKTNIKNEMFYVNILIQNGWYRPIRGKIKLEFYDENGIQLDNPWGWHPLLLESHQEEWFKFIAPKKEDEISKFKIMIRGIGSYSIPENN